MNIPRPSDTFSTQPGLVCLLTEYSVTLPLSPASTTSSALAILLPDIAHRTGIEVADFLDARQQTDIALSEVGPEWLAGFADYLTLFYPSEVVDRYLAAVRFVQAQNSIAP